VSKAVLGRATRKAIVKTTSVGRRGVKKGVEAEEQKM